MVESEWPKTTGRSRWSKPVNCASNASADDASTRSMPSFALLRRDHLSKVRTGFARTEPGRSRCIYGCDISRSCCLRHPYGVMPRGLYTENAVARSNATNAAPALATS